MATEIPLTQGYTSIVDDEDAETMSKYSWCATVKRTKASGKKHIYVSSNIDGRTVSMHRLLLSFPPYGVDHKDGNGLNNCRSNLRVASPSQNSANQKRPGRFGFKGIKFSTSRSKPFRARLRCIGLPSFESHPVSTAEEAARAYDDAARAKWGEFCCVNFPRPGERSALTGEIEPEAEAVGAAADR